jgi:molecular chaperone DnaJ
MVAESRDYYEILGVAKTASAEDIKKAYRNLARKYHPDVNRAEDAADKFKEIQRAYDTLSDDTKRQQYDRFGAEGPGMGAGGAGFEGFGDIFDIFFGGGMGGARSQAGPTVVRGDDLREDLELTLEEVATGVEKTIKFRRFETCDTCTGSGAQPGTQTDTCPQCHGSGQIRFAQNTILGTFQGSQTCTKCRGTGKVIPNPCTTCSGTGRQRKMRERSVKVPAGTPHGLRLRLVGEGDAGERGGPSGDLYLVLFVQEHDVFQRDGNDLYMEVPISFARAALGDTLKIPQIVGGEEDLKIPEGTQSGQTFSLRGKGLTDINGRGKGDLHVVVRVQVPTKLTQEQRELLRQFAATTGETLQQAESKGILGRIFGH